MNFFQECCLYRNMYNDLLPKTFCIKKYQQFKTQEKWIFYYYFLTILPPQINIVFFKNNFSRTSRRKIKIIQIKNDHHISGF